MNKSELEKFVSYDPETGLMTRIYSERYWHVGKVMERHNKGYIVFDIAEHEYKVHSVAWILMTGEAPPKDMEIDHINGIRDDNRWANLRLATPSQNQMNRKLRSDNKCGLKGVKRSGGGFCATIQRNGHRDYIGYFHPAREAHIAYVLEALESYGEFARFS